MNTVVYEEGDKLLIDFESLFKEDGSHCPVSESHVIRFESGTNTRALKLKLTSGIVTIPESMDWFKSGDVVTVSSKPNTNFIQVSKTTHTPTVRGPHK